MKDYDPRVRPSRNGTDALNVTFGMALAQIIDVVSQRTILHRTNKNGTILFLIDLVKFVFRIDI